MVSCLLNADRNENFDNDWNDNNCARKCFIKHAIQLLASYSESESRNDLVALSKSRYSKAKMKTYKNLYIKYLDKIFLRNYIADCIRDKPYYKRINGKLEQYLNYIHSQLVKRDFPLKETRNKIIHDRKKDRDITFSPFFPNKIYDYLIAYPLNPIVEHSSYYWSIGNIEGKGKDMGVGYVAKNFRKYKYAVHLDIKKFYDSIVKEKLYQMVSKRISDRDYLNFYRSVITLQGKGLPLGLPSSQPLSNIYLLEFDYYVKQTLKVEVYCRSVDDIVIMANNKMKLLNHIRMMGRYLKELGLKFKPNWYISNKRIKFLGYVITKTSLCLQKPTFHKIGRLWKRTSNHKSPKRASTLISLKGWLQITTNFQHYYETHLRPLVSFEELKQIAYRRK